MTAQEQQIFKLSAQGLTVAEIAMEMKLTQRTVRLIIRGDIVFKVRGWKW